MSRKARAGRPESSSPRHVGGALHELAHNLGIEKTLKNYDVLTSWQSIVGEQIARVTTVQRIESGILFVSVSTAPWRAELTMRRQEIMKKVNAAVGRDVIKDIRFR
jgi:predicted nucleic acid-binding Zn ribbon protein